MGEPLVVNGATLMCAFGVAPCPLVVPPLIVTAGSLPAATINDNKPANIATFGMCTTLSNPQVAAATSAAMGVLTPMPCLPVITAPRMPGSLKVTIGGVAALTSSSQCMCMWGGVVTVMFPGQGTVTG
jgi:hypothetical protein